MTNLVMTEETFLGEVKSQAYKLHCAAYRGDFEEMRKLFEKIVALRDANRDRERELQTQKTLELQRSPAAQWGDPTACSEDA